MEVVGTSFISDETTYQVDIEYLGLKYTYSVVVLSGSFGCVVVECKCNERFFDSYTLLKKSERKKLRIMAEQAALSLYPKV